MEYAIHTLEIELGRVRMAYRKASEAVITYEDARETGGPDYRGMKKHIKVLEDAIKVLKDWKEANPEYKAEADMFSESY